MSVLYCVIFRKRSSVSMHPRILLNLSSIRFRVIGIMLRYLMHLDLSFVHDNSYGSICNILYIDIQLNQHHLLKMLSFFHCTILASSLKLRSYVYRLMSGALI